MDLRERGAIAARHPWELARGAFFRELLEEHTSVADVRRMLDVGAGDGWFAGELKSSLPPSAEVICWDVNYSGDDLAEPMPAGLSRVVEPPDGRFDLITVLDVIEHVVDDAAFLDDDVLPRLAPDGLLVVSVPAHQALFCAHDVALGHHRRYSRRQLDDLLGPRVETIARGGLFSTLLVPRLAAVGLERLGRQANADGVGAWDHGPRTTAAVTSVLRTDAVLGRRLSRRGVELPTLSIWSICRPLAGR